jgi:hypothetical protein
LSLVKTESGYRVTIAPANIGRLNTAAQLAPFYRQPFGIDSAQTYQTTAKRPTRSDAPPAANYLPQ